MKILKYIFISVYILFVLTSSFLLLTFNKFSDSVIGDKTISSVKENMGKFKKGDLIIIHNNNKIKVDDEIIFYDTNNNKNFLNIAKAQKIMHTNEKEITYVIRDNEYLSSEYVVGTVNSAKKINGLGYIYRIFTSKIGYLLFVMVPLITYFIIILKSGDYVKKKNKSKSSIKN